MLVVSINSFRKMRYALHLLKIHFHESSWSFVCLKQIAHLFGEIMWHFINITTLNKIYLICC